MEKMFAEQFVPKVSTAAGSLASGATGARVKIAGARRVAFIVNVGAGTSTTAHSFALKQHDAATAGNSYDLNSDNPIYHKINAATEFTRLNVDTAVATNALHTQIGQSVAVVIFEVLPEQLRSDCKWVSLDVVSTAGTQVGNVLALVDTDFDPAYAQTV